MAKKSKKTVAIPGLGEVQAYSTVAEGEYKVAITDVEQKESASSEFDYLSWELTILEGKSSGQKLWYITSFNPKSLWNLKLWLEAIEADIPDEPEDVAISDLVGLEVMVTVSHEEYEGKTRARVNDFAPVGAESDKEDVQVEDEESEDKEDEKYSIDELKDMDDEELEELVKKHELELDLTKYKTAKKRVNAVIATLEEEGLLEDEET